MTKPKFLIIAAVLLALCLSTAYAGNERRIGTAGAAELLIPTDARGAALGGSIIATATGVSALHWNPAGAAFLEGTEAMFTHIPWLADINIEYAAIATNIEDFGVIGFSAKVVDIGDIEETTEQFPDGTGRIFSPTLAVIGLSYARSVTTNINFGFTGRLLREDVFEVSATGFAFDFGFTYEPRWKGLTLGLVMKNFGPDMKFTGRGFERASAQGVNRPLASKNAAFELPTSVNIGMAYNFVNNDLHSATMTGNFQANNLSTDYWQGGVEYTYDSWLSLRSGYAYSNQEGYIYGATLGGGVSRQLGDILLSVEYTWWQTDVFDNNQFFTVKASF